MKRFKTAHFRILGMFMLIAGLTFTSCKDSSTSAYDEKDMVSSAQSVGDMMNNTVVSNVYFSDENVLTYDVIKVPANEQDPGWRTNVCTPSGALAMNDQRWTREPGQTAYNVRDLFSGGLHPYEVNWNGIHSPANFGEADWIFATYNNQAVNVNSEGQNHNWSRYELPVDGTGTFELKLLADNCSWIYLDDKLVGYQDDDHNPDIQTADVIRYGVTLDGPATLTYITFAGGPGGAVGGKFRLETTTEVIPEFVPPVEEPEKPETITLTGLIRDFKAHGSDGGHPDFENPANCCAHETGIVEELLGSDGKPVYAGGVGRTTTNAYYFNQWYNDVVGVNMRTTHDFVLELQDDGTYTYSNEAFFPIDNILFGNQGRAHNFHFTTEIHTTFTYTGGEVFTFSGDDDVWVFINGNLVIDIGGIHGPITRSVNLDDLNLNEGEDYPLDIFQAERQTVGSNFSITTTLQLVSEPVEPVVINNPPVADAGPDQTVTATAPSTPITLDGSGSSDPDGDSLTYSWTLDGVVVGTTASPVVSLEKGSYTLTLTVSDGELSDTDEVNVNVLNSKPVADAGPDQIVTATGLTTPITLDGSGSSDVDGDELTYSWTLNGDVVASEETAVINLTKGSYTLILTVSDGDLTDTDEVNVTVLNTIPVADAGEAQTHEATGPTTSVTLDGSGSSDVDGDELTYSWTLDGDEVSTEVSPKLNLGVGVHTITLTVTDEEEATDSAEVVITITDTTAPVLSFSQVIGNLWPPNHKMVLVATGISAHDLVDGATAVTVTVSSNEAINGKGDGNTDWDWEVVMNADGSQDVYVRSERSGRGNGRTYTISMSTSDVAGNSSSDSLEVKVAQNQGRGR